MLMLGLTEPSIFRKETTVGQRNEGYNNTPLWSSLQISDYGSPLIILKENFRNGNYPQRAYNPFCPFCLKEVNKTSDFLVHYQSFFQKTYLTHEECLKSQENSCLRTIMEEIDHGRVTVCNQIDKTSEGFFGADQYFLELQMAHCLTSKSYFRLRNKIRVSSYNRLSWRFDKQLQGLGMPDIVVFPFLDFELSLSGSKMGDNKNRFIHKVFVDVEKAGTPSDCYLRVSTSELDLVLKMITGDKEKKEVIEKMNYKYRYPLGQNFPLIQLIACEVKTLAESKEEEYICDEEHSNITELLNQDSSCFDSLPSTSPYRKKEKPKETESQAGEKVNLPWLIENNYLGEYVRNNASSRCFQDFLTKEADHDQLQLIVETLGGQFGQLVTHDYANYMMQKLFSCCSEQQRLTILKELLPDLPAISMSTQGTHTLQSFVALMNRSQDMTLLIERISPCFLQLSNHSNGTHLIQKIICCFPLSNILSFFSLTVNYFRAMATNKFGMCVVKQMMKKVSNYQYFQFQRSILGVLLHNLPQIITDPYGNYVVQFAYEYFGLNSCTIITDFIVQHFGELSARKYSGDTVLKCVDTYWKGHPIIEQLKDVLSGEVILKLFGCKEGNKVLLVLVEKWEGSAVQQKICSQLMLVEPSRFERDRWGVALGSRSWTVGAHFDSFTQAMRPKKNRPFNNIH